MFLPRVPVDFTVHQGQRAEKASDTVKGFKKFVGRERGKPLSMLQGLSEGTLVKGTPSNPEEK